MPDESQVASPSSRITPSNPESPSALDEHPTWLRWAPYLAARQWGTVREDYSAEGAAWEFFPHDHARSRSFRWGEDGLLGVSDDQGLLCFSTALWNESDPILKERLFGLTGNEGNRGEDVKEAYFFLDNTPHHSYMKALDKYPQQAFPYDDLISENSRRSREDDEYELVDTGVFDENRYFDITIEYAKAAPEDILIRISATNRGPDSAPIHILPTLWFRNTWSWGRASRKPELLFVKDDKAPDHALAKAYHWLLGDYSPACEGNPALLFTENETNTQRLWNLPNAGRYVKDGINDFIVNGETGSVNPAQTGTKVAAHHHAQVNPADTATFNLRLSHTRHRKPFADSEQIFRNRIEEADQATTSARMNDVSSGRRMRGCSGANSFITTISVPGWTGIRPVRRRPPCVRKGGTLTGHTSIMLM